MDSQKPTKMKKLGLWLLGLLGVPLFFAAGLLFTPMLWKQGRVIASTVAQRSNANVYLQLYQDAWNSIIEKSRHLHRVDETNMQLQFENTRLRLELESQRYGYQKKQSKNVTQAFQLKLKENT